MCPWAYQTSKWIRTVRDRTGLEVRWRFFSLEEINRVEGKKHPWEREWSYGWSMLRIGALLRREDEALLDAWYERAGRALHEEGRQPHRPEVAEELLAELGLDPGLVAAAIADPTTNDDVRAEHDRVVAAGAFGVPTLFFPDGQCIFGPVVVDPPDGDEALALWQLVELWLQFPHLYEIQRPKVKRDLQLIATTFRPYLEARAWKHRAEPDAMIAFPGHAGRSWPFARSALDVALRIVERDRTVTTYVDRERAITGLADVWSRLDDLLADVDEADWHRPTHLAGWDVQDNVAHVIGTEADAARRVPRRRDRPGRAPARPQRHRRLQRAVGAVDAVGDAGRRAQPPPRRHVAAHGGAAGDGRRDVERRGLHARRP